MSEYNAAFSYNYANALGGKIPGCTIDYAKALVSRDDLPNANDMQATVTGTDVFFTWIDNIGVGRSAYTDVAILVAYCEEQTQTLFRNVGATHSSAPGTLNVKDFVGKAIQTWPAFISKDSKDASNSVYTGEVAGQADSKGCKRL